jgi:unsaturated rhamnogalacturonyl hydrolase
MRASRAATGGTARPALTRLTRLTAFATLATLGTLGTSAVGCSSSSSGGAQPIACTPIAPTTSDAFARAHAPDSPDIALARAIADRWLAVHRPEDATWDWGDGVQLGALMELHRVTGDARYRDHVQRFFDAQLANGYEFVNSDRCPPALSALVLYGETCDAKYRTVVDDMQRYLDSDALRTTDGGISHFGTLDTFGATLWVDSLYMFGQVEIRRGELWNDPVALELYGSQYRIFAKHLQDATSGWFVHAYQWAGAQDPNVFWGRGNGWVVATAADYLRVRGARGEADPEVRASFLRLAQAVVAAQDSKTGLFWTVLNRPGETYLETSATALFALGLARARRAGVLDATSLDTVHRAMDGVRTRIVNDAQGRPVVTGISGPTSVGQFKDYAAVPLKDDVHFGVGAVILALIEVSGLS